MHINDELSIKSMTVNQVYSLYVERKLKVNRQYQRKLCWTIEEKRNFIDTVSNGYPVPLFLLAIDECGVYEIIDGMQRLDALCTFIEQKYELRDGYFNLESMPDTLQLKRKGVLKQGRQILSIEKCKDIANYPLPISVFPARDSSIEEVFKRINSTGKHLSSQELRQIGVQTEYATLVRQLSSEMRGDYSEDTLLLNDMSNISLSNYRLKYAINVNDVFWVKNGIINANELRQSRDEEIVGFLLAGIILNGEELKIYSTGNFLNKLYGYSRNPLNMDKPFEMTQIGNAIDRIGVEQIKKNFRIVMSCIKDTIMYSDMSFRTILSAPKSISDISIQFQIIFMAIYKIMIQEGKREYDRQRICSILIENGTYLLDAESKSGVKLNGKIDMLYGLLVGTFWKKEFEDPAVDDWAMQCVNILNRSRTEQCLYDFKVGLVNVGDDKINEDVLEKILKTLTAINNLGAKKTGYVLVGIGDSEENVKKLCDYYAIDYKMEGDFPIVGVEHDANAVKLSLDRYSHNIKELIRKSKSIPEDYKLHLLTNMRTPKLYGKQLIIFKTCFNDPVAYQEEFYIRQFTDVAKVEGNQIASVIKGFYQK